MPIWILFLPIFTSHLVYLSRRKTLFGTLKPKINQKELEYAKNVAIEMLLLQLRKERIQDPSSSYNVPPLLGEAIEGMDRLGGPVKRGLLLGLLCKQKGSKSSPTLPFEVHSSLSSSKTVLTMTN